MAVMICLSLPSAAGAAQVTLAWDASDSAPEGYHVFMRIEGQTYDYSTPAWSGTATTCTIGQLADNTYYFVSRAFQGDRQSVDSNEVEYKVVINQAPQADAGSDQAVSANTQVTLDGSASTDPEGPIATYNWTQITGPTVRLANAAGAQAAFTAPDVASISTLDFKLTVSDAEGLTASDICQVTVLPVAPTDNDSDNDGLTDTEEIDIYGTDPNNPDTDGDGIPDGEEVSNGTNPTEAAIDNEKIFIATADAFVSSRDPNTNFGNATAIEVDGSPEKISYMRFDVSGLSGAVQTAFIRLTVTDASQFGGTIYLISDNSWDEDSVTYNTRPTIDGLPLFEPGAVNVGDVVELDITPAITGNGIYSFALVSDITNGADYHSREALNNQPELIVITDGQNHAPKMEELFFIPVADTFVSSDSPGANFGNVTAIEVDGSPEKISYLRFDVSGLSGAVQTAFIRLTVTNPSQFGGTIYLVSDNSWDEYEVTYNSRPQLGNQLLDELGEVSVGDVVELDVTSAIPGDGFYSFAIVSDNRNGADYNSREALNNPPELIVTTDGSNITPVTEEIIFAPIADTFVNEQKPNNNYGSATAIEVDGSPEKMAYIKFDVNGLSGTVQLALIKLTVTDQSQFGGSLYLISDNSWDEDDVTYNSRPQLGNQLLDELSEVSVGDVVELDVTSAITSDGLYSFAIVSNNRNGADYLSKEHIIRPPQLNIVVQNYE